jgi:hypothetical protein
VYKSGLYSKIHSLLPIVKPTYYPSIAGISVLVIGVGAGTEACPEMHDLCSEHPDNPSWIIVCTAYDDESICRYNQD